jgi:hypothetical protein
MTYKGHQIQNFDIAPKISGTILKSGFHMQNTVFDTKHIITFNNSTFSNYYYCQHVRVNNIISDVVLVSTSYLMFVFVCQQSIFSNYYHSQRVTVSIASNVYVSYDLCVISSKRSKKVQTSI